MLASDFKQGDKVTYRPTHGPMEFGIVKRTTEVWVFVVYKCGSNWDRFMDYTAAATDPKELTKGWQ